MDSRRSQHLYRYLCNRFALAYKGNGVVNDQQTADNLGNKNLRKVVGALFPPSETPGKERDLPKRITTGELVKILTHLRREPSSAVNDEGSLRRLSREDVLTALYKLVELTPEERDDLGLPAGDGIALLQRSLLVLQTTGGLENHGMLLKIYKAAIGLDFGRAEDSLQNLEAVDGLIAEVVRDALPELDTSNLKSRSKYKQDKQDKYNEARETRIQELTRKAQREIRRLIARSGNQQLAGSGDGQAMVNAYIRRYLQPAFVRKLTQTLVTNEELTDQFPLYLKRITLLPAGPLPLPINSFSINPLIEKWIRTDKTQVPTGPC